ncbi:MAG: hypothetical protein V4751_14595 [Pseudomonadota bacterium]
MNRSIRINERTENAQLLTGSIQLFDIKGDVMEDAVQNHNGVILEITYELDGVVDTIKYPLIRRVELYADYPT